MNGRKGTMHSKKGETKGAMKSMPKKSKGAKGRGY
jgi:hypothetical protein